MISWAAWIHVASHFCFLKYSSLWWGWRTSNIVSTNNSEKKKKDYTHSNLVDFWIISLVVVSVHSLLSNSESSADGKGETVWTVRWSGKDLVNVIHCQNHCTKFRVPQEKKMVVCLKTCQTMSCKWKWKGKKPQNTCKTSWSSPAILHSDGTNSYLQRSKSQVAVIVSIAGRYSNVKLSMSNIEFHWVETSCGIMQWERWWAVNVLYHCGRRIVVEFLSTKAILCSFQRSVNVGLGIGVNWEW